jgi:hypothetical protein
MAGRSQFKGQTYYPTNQYAGMTVNSIGDMNGVDPSAHTQSPHCGYWEFYGYMSSSSGGSPKAVVLMNWICYVRQDRWLLHRYDSADFSFL